MKEEVCDVAVCILKEAVKGFVLPNIFGSKAETACFGCSFVKLSVGYLRNAQK